MFATLSLSLVKLFLDFLNDCWGMLNKPYETSRQIAIKKPILPIFIMASLVWTYLSLAVIVKFGLHTGPIFLTFNLGRLFYAVASLYFLVAISIYVIGKFFGGKGEIFSILSLWSFSYLPTIIWFFLTTALYIVLPPPRTLSILGQLFSIFYLFLSLGLLSWKILLFLLTLRHGMKLNFWQMVRATVVLWPFFVMLFLLFNRMEIFKVPFA